MELCAGNNAGEDSYNASYKRVFGTAEEEQTMK